MKSVRRLIPLDQLGQAEPFSRLPGAFGPRFHTLLILGFIWLGPAWWDLRFLWGMAIWDFLAILVWVWDLRHMPAPEQLEIQRTWKGPLTLNTPSLVNLSVRNHGHLPVHITLQDEVPEALSPPGKETELSVPSGETRSESYRVFPVSRGDHAIGRTFLRYSGPLRIAERWGVADLSQTVRTYPSLEEARRHTVYLIRSRQRDMEKRIRRHRGQGREFESLREYRDGDEWRNICWTATARRGKLITKTYQMERSQKVWIVLDCGRLLQARTGTGTKLDSSVNAALSLAQVALYTGDQVGLLAYGRRPQYRLEPARGTTQLRSLIEQLSVVAVEPYEANHHGAAELLLTSQKRRSLIVWITDLAETAALPDVIESASRLLPRHFVLFVVLAHKELNQLASRKPQNEKEMYRIVAAHEMLQRRELLLRHLRSRGALTLELSPTSLSAGLVKHYLDIKDKSLL